MARILYKSTNKAIGTVEVVEGTITKRYDPASDSFALSVIGIIMQVNRKEAEHIKAFLNACLSIPKHGK